MENAYTRRKQPERVRRTLLDCAARLAAEQGLAGVTVQAVAAAAGVTKGGLFHHFPNKQALVESVFCDLLEQLDAEIDAFIAKDDGSKGSFTRAYIEAFFADRQRGRESPWAALSVSMITDPGLRQLWFRWLNGRLERHRDTDEDPAFEIARLAADGAWFAHVLDQDGAMPDLDALRARLLGLTR